MKSAKRRNRNISWYRNSHPLIGTDKKRLKGRYKHGDTSVISNFRVSIANVTFAVVARCRICYYSLLLAPILAVGISAVNSMLQVICPIFDAFFYSLLVPL